MQFLKINHQDAYNFDTSVSDKARQALDCLRNYSKEKFKDVQKFLEFKILIVNIYNCELDQIFSEVKTMEINRERYITAIKDLIDMK